MSRCAAILALAGCLLGCRAPAPSMSALSPYGGTRIEPPHTGSYGTADSYYQPPATGTKPPVSARGDTSLPPRTDQVASNLTPEPSAADADLAWRSPNIGGANGGRARASIGALSDPAGESRSGVQTIAYEEPVEDESVPSYTPGSTLRLIEPTPPPSSGSSVTLNGMPVNDATMPSEPRAFAPRGPVRDISELPEPSDAVRARIRTADAATMRSTTTSSSAPDDSGWRLR